MLQFAPQPAGQLAQLGFELGGLDAQLSGVQGEVRGQLQESLLELREGLDELLAAQGEVRTNVEQALLELRGQLGSSVLARIDAELPETIYLQLHDQLLDGLNTLEFDLRPQVRSQLLQLAPQLQSAFAQMDEDSVREVRQVLVNNLSDVISSSDSEQTQEFDAEREALQAEIARLRSEIEELSSSSRRHAATSISAGAPHAQELAGFEALRAHADAVREMAQEQRMRAQAEAQNAQAQASRYRELALQRSGSSRESAEALQRQMEEMRAGLVQEAEQLQSQMAAEAEARRRYAEDQAQHPGRAGFAPRAAGSSSSSDCCQGDDLGVEVPSRPSVPLDPADAGKHRVRIAVAGSSLLPGVYTLETNGHGRSTWIDTDGRIAVLGSDAEDSEGQGGVWFYSESSEADEAPACAEESEADAGEEGEEWGEAWGDPFEPAFGEDWAAGDWGDAWGAAFGEDWAEEFESFHRESGAADEDDCDECTNCAADQDCGACTSCEDCGDDSCQAPAPPIDTRREQRRAARAPSRPDGPGADSSLFGQRPDGPPAGSSSPFGVGPEDRHVAPGRPGGGAARVPGMPGGVLPVPAQPPAGLSGSEAQLLSEMCRLLEEMRDEVQGLRGDLRELSENIQTPAPQSGRAR